MRTCWEKNHSSSFNGFIYTIRWKYFSGLSVFYITWERFIADFFFFCFKARFEPAVQVPLIHELVQVTFSQKKKIWNGNDRNSNRFEIKFFDDQSWLRLIFFCTINLINIYVSTHDGVAEKKILKRINNILFASHDVNARK